MYKAILNRTTDNGIQTLGVLELYNNEEKLIYTCKTLELPNKDNKSKVSCIPQGIYEVKKTKGSPNIKYTHFDILNVPNRTGIKIHKGNYYSQIMGCILVGTGYSDINKDGQLDVVNSQLALDKLLTYTDGFKLQIL